MMKELKLPPKVGDVRVKKRFAYFPIYEYKKIDGKYYFCWWQYYYIQQSFLEKKIYAGEYGNPEIMAEWITTDRWI